MTAYNVEYSYTVEEFGNVVVNADDIEQAEDYAKDFILDLNPEIAASTLVIDSVKEVL